MKYKGNVKIKSEGESGKGKTKRKQGKENAKKMETKEE